MQAIRINDRLSIVKQPKHSDFSELARQGFKAVINNRPNGEDSAQPGSGGQAAGGGAGRRLKTPLILILDRKLR